MDQVIIFILVEKNIMQKFYEKGQVTASFTAYEDFANYSPGEYK